MMLTLNLMPEVKVKFDGWIFSERAQRASEWKSIGLGYFLTMNIMLTCTLTFEVKGHMLKLVLTVWVLCALIPIQCLH